MSEILVTGGFGFVGTHLVEELVKQQPEDNIHIVDNLSTSTVDYQRFWGELDNPQVSFDIASVDDFLAENSRLFNEIYHLASIVGPAGVLPHAGTIAGTIINDADLVATKALDWNARLVNISTSEIYGGGYSKEDDPKIVPAEVTVRLEYAVGKLAAEVALVNRHRAHGLNVVNIRPFNIAGSRQSAEGGFVLPRFVQSALKDEDLTVFGDGSQIRAFTHVKDTVAGIRLAMNKGAAGEAYNLGDEQGMTTITELARLVIALVHSDSNIAFVDPKTIYGELYAEANDKVPISMKARKELGWRATRTLKDIVFDCIEWEKIK